MSNAISTLSTNDTRMTTRPNSNRYRQNNSYRNSAPSFSHFSSSTNQRETHAQLVAFTPPLMSLQLPYPESQTYQRNYRSNRSYTQHQQQPSLPMKNKSETATTQPEYYVDSFTSNFSNKPSSNSNNDKKVKHVTFQEPDKSVD